MFLHSGFRRRLPIEDRPPYPLNNHKGNNAALPTRTTQQHIKKKLSAFEGDEICLISTRTLYPRPPSDSGSPRASLSSQPVPRRTTINQVMGPALRDFNEQITVLDKICNTRRQKDVGQSYSSSYSSSSNNNRHKTKALEAEQVSQQLATAERDMQRAKAEKATRAVQEERMALLGRKFDALSAEKEKEDIYTRRGHFIGCCVGDCSKSHDGGDDSKAGHPMCNCAAGWCYDNDVHGV